MPAPNIKQEIQEVPLKLVGGNLFGRYNKISVEQTWNFIVSNDALVPYAGYKNVVTQSPTLAGRALYSSSRGNLMVAVWGATVYAISANLTVSVIGSLVTASGDVFVAENNNGEIAFTDNVHVYVYNWNAPTSPLLYQSGTDFSVPTSLVNPGYISFQNGRLLTVNTTSNAWFLSEPNNAITWPSTANYSGSLQTKPDKVQAAVPSPGGGNNLYLFGHNVVEQWQDVGKALFPYQRSSTFNVDYGVLNASSIAAMDDYVVWLAGNEQSGAALMVIEGNRAVKISTDGIDYVLANLTNPNNCTGFLFRQDGHVIYQFTFPDDNLSYAYDFNTKLFFTVTDENLNYHIARQVVYFNDTYYFVSLKGGDLFAFGTEFTNYEYASDDIKEIPRLRVCPPLRLPSQRMYILKSIGFTIENGRINNVYTSSNVGSQGARIDTEDSFNITTEDGVYLVTEYEAGATFTYTSYSEAVDLSISRDGGESFGNSWRNNMNVTGKRKSRFIWQSCGQANDTSIQFRFSGFGRFVAFDGVCEIYQ